MSHTPRRRWRTSMLVRIGLLAGAATLIASCSCSPYGPGGGATTTTEEPGSTTTVVDASSTTTTSVGPTTTTTSTATTTSTIPDVEPGDTVAVGSLRPGQCATPTSDDLFVESFQVTECDNQHANEVIAIYDIPDGTYPGDEYPGNSLIGRDAYERCQPLFEGYVGTPFWDSVYDIKTITPAASTWAEGDRTVVCLVNGVDGEMLTTAARGSGA